MKKIIIGVLLSVFCINATFADYSDVKILLTDVLERKDYKTQLYIFDTLDTFLPVKQEELFRKIGKNSEQGKDISYLQQQVNILGDFIAVTNNLRTSYLQSEDIQKGEAIEIGNTGKYIVFPKIFSDVQIKKENSLFPNDENARGDVFVMYFKKTQGDYNNSVVPLFYIKEVKKGGNSTMRLFEGLDLFGTQELESTVSVSQSKNPNFLFETDDAVYTYLTSTHGEYKGGNTTDAPYIESYKYFHSLLKFRWRTLSDYFKYNVCDSQLEKCENAWVKYAI